MKLILGDCLDKLKELDDDSIDSIVTDPPAGISFMNKEFDHNKGGRDQWIKWLESIMVECLRVLKPGGHALVWALPRTSHWTGFAIENAGFEIRDCIQHVFGSGFPKNMDISENIDNAKGLKRKVIGTKLGLPGYSLSDHKAERNALYDKGLDNPKKECDITAPVSEEAKQWDGWGTALKPSNENWWLCRKPISEKRIIDNVLKHGTGGINIDGCRVGTDELIMNGGGEMGKKTYGKMERDKNTITYDNKGRWPSNFIMSHDEGCTDKCVDGCPIKMMDEQSGVLKSGECKNNKYGGIFGDGKKITNPSQASIGTASRFFPNFTPEYDPFHYFAKASVSERNDGLEGMEKQPNNFYKGLPDLRMAGTQNRTEKENHHPTVKSLSLMRWLITLITPPKGIVLDPFMGSGSTGCAAAQLGFDFIGIEKEPEYMEIAKKRIDHAKHPHGQLGLF